MARVIQEHIKKPLADEVLFGKLKSGGHVRVVVIKDENGEGEARLRVLDGPVTPKPEKLPVPPRSKPRRRRTHRPKGDGPGGSRGSVPKVPLVKV